MNTPSSSQGFKTGSPKLGYEDYKLLYFTQLLKRRICGVKFSQKIGKVTDLIFRLVDPYPEAVGIYVEHSMGRPNEFIPWEKVVKIDDDAIFIAPAENGQPYPSFVDQKGGKTTTEATVTVSADGKLLTIKSKSYPMGGGAPQSSSLRLKRVGVLPAGVHATSGNWVPTGFTDTDADLTFTFKSNGDELTMTDPTGDSYTAKFDGGNYPFKGSYQTDAVSLKKIDAHTIEETDKHNGTVTNVSKMTVSANGKTMTMVSHDPQRDVTSTFVATKK